MEQGETTVLTAMMHTFCSITTVTVLQTLTDDTRCYFVNKIEDYFPPTIK